MNYSSSPSSINSQNISEYSIFSCKQDNSPRESSYVIENHPEDYSSFFFQETASVIGNNPPVVRRRCTANRKERRRTEALNNAFSDLRNCIPNIPKDTKLSKIKTLKHAISHIAFLMKTLQSKDPNVAYSEFTTDISSGGCRRRELHAVQFPLKSDKVSVQLGFCRLLIGMRGTGTERTFGYILTQCRKLHSLSPTDFLPLAENHIYKICNMHVYVLAIEQTYTSSYPTSNCRDHKVKIFSYVALLFILGKKSQQSILFIRDLTSLIHKKTARYLKKCHST